MSSIQTGNGGPVRPLAGCWPAPGRGGLGLCGWGGWAGMKGARAGANGAIRHYGWRPGTCDLVAVGMHPKPAKPPPSLPT